MSDIGSQSPVGAARNIPDVVVVMNFFGVFSQIVISHKLSKICIHIFYYKIPFIQLFVYRLFDYRLVYFLAILPGHWHYVVD